MDFRGVIATASLKRRYDSLTGTKTGGSFRGIRIAAASLKDDIVMTNVFRGVIAAPH